MHGESKTQLGETVEGWSSNVIERDGCRNIARFHLSCPIGPVLINNLQIKCDFVTVFFIL
jgi:hypothetical protein